MTQAVQLHCIVRSLTPTGDRVGFSEELTVPAATASPCSHSPYPSPFSIAWRTRPRHTNTPHTGHTM